MLRILLIEDDEMDRRLLDEALRECSVQVELSSVGDGREALALLNGNAEAVPWTPNLIVCDLNMPGMGGHDFLRVAKSDPRLKSIPVIMLTSSESRRDVSLCYQLHANCYVRKPATFDGLCLVARSITGFWLQTVRLPVPEMT